MGRARAHKEALLSVKCYFISLTQMRVSSLSLLFFAPIIFLFFASKGLLLDGDGRTRTTVYTHAG